MTINWTNTKITLGELKPWTENPRTTTKAQAKRLLKSWEDFGQVETVAIGPDNSVYDGHQRLSALLTVHGADYQIDARQSDRPLTDDERRKLVITLHAGAVGSWDWDKLSSWEPAQMMGDGFDADLLKDWKRDVSALDNFLKSEKPEPVDAEPQIDRAEELRQKWQVETGQMWQLGEHRIICGDCTDAAVVERVMMGEMCKLIVTDPPYGVSYADKNKFLNAISPANRVETPIENDHESKEKTQELWRNAFEKMNEVMGEGAVIYSFMPQGGDQMMMMMMMMMNAGIEPRHEIIWVKNNHVLGRVDYAYKHEPIIYAWKKGGHKFYGDFQTSLIECDRPLISDLHPTMKPVELIEKLIKNSSLQSEIVYEPFSGSGTTLIACENLSRKCRAVEISPAYVAVALERWSVATGKTPVLMDDNG